MTAKQVMLSQPTVSMPPLAAGPRIVIHIDLTTLAEAINVELRMTEYP